MTDFDEYINFGNPSKKKRRHTLGQPPSGCRHLNRILILVSIIFIVAVVFVCGLGNSIEITTYEINSEKVSESITLVFVSDLHSCKYGENASELITEVKSLNPDIVLLGGDFFDDKLSPQSAQAFLDFSTKHYPTYYASGNHEYWSGQVDALKQRVRDAGAKVLEAETDTLMLKGSTFVIGGVDDPTYIKNDSLEKQLNHVSEKIGSEQFSILLSHRPELVNMYAKYDFDLILAGHAHGGQWRLPHFLKQGVYSPNEGFFPKYTSGKFPVGKGIMIVSRGLSKESTRLPRLYNHPELVMVKLKPTNALSSR